MDDPNPKRFQKPLNYFSTPLRISFSSFLMKELISFRLSTIFVLFRRLAHSTTPMNIRLARTVRGIKLKSGLIAIAMLIRVIGNPISVATMRFLSCSNSSCSMSSLFFLRVKIASSLSMLITCQNKNQTYRYQGDSDERIERCGKVSDGIISWC